MAGLPRTETERRGDINFLRAVKDLDVSFDTHSLSARLNETGHNRPGTVGTYREMGRFCIEEFYEQAGIDDEVVPRIATVGKTGFNVLRRIIGSAPEDYVSYCESQGKPVDTEVLRSALKNSKLPQKLAGLPLDTATLAETTLGIGNDTGPLRTGTLVFVEDGQGLSYQAMPGLLDEFLVNPFYPNHMPQNLQKCPAKGMIITKIQTAMVDLAIDTPEVIPAHLKVLI